MADSKAEIDIKKEIAYFMARAYSRSLTTSTGGNISRRVGDYMYITCSGKDKSSLSADDIAKVSIATGENLTKDLKLSIESDMHRFIYQKRDDVNAIVHSHPTFACLFSSSDKEIDTTLIAESWYLLDRVSRISYARMGTKELAIKVSDYFDCSDIDCPIGVPFKPFTALLENHGAITLGKDLLSAFDRMECLEQAAKMSAFLPLVNGKGISKDGLDEIARMRG